MGKKPIDFSDVFATGAASHETHPLQLTIADSFSEGDSHVLRCPVCGQEYNHIQEVLTERHPDADEALGPYRGTKEMEDDPRNRGRRPALCIVIGCESGHFWSFLLQQHKGSLYAYSRYEWQTHDIEKVAESPVHELVYLGVVISSRYGRRHELDLMCHLIDLMPEPLRVLVRKISCDSKAGAHYSLDCMGSDTECEMILDNLEEALRVLAGGHNGIFMENQEDVYREPEWYETFEEDEP